MDFRVVIMVIMLSLPTPVAGGIRKRDTVPRATCTAPVATKGETAVVTCHYPLDVEQLGEMVSVSVERYPFTSSSTGFPSSDHILECQWDGNYTCALDREEHRVEGKEVVITINNVNEGSQGQYVCTMMVKDGPIIHGDPCQLLLNGTIPSDLLPQATTEPAMDQQNARDTDTSSAGQMSAGTIAGIVVGCAVVVMAVVVVVAVCVWKKRGAGPPEAQTQTATETDMETETKLLLEGEADQHLRPDQKSPRPWDHGSKDYAKNGTGPKETQTWTLLEAPLLTEGEQDHHPHPGQKSPRPWDHGSEGDANKDDRPKGRVRAGAKHFEGKRTHLASVSRDDRPKGRVRAGAKHFEGKRTHSASVSRDDRSKGRVRREMKRIEGKQACSTPDIRQLGSRDDRPEGRVLGKVKLFEGKLARSTSDIRASNETEETETALGEEEKENDANETDERQERKQDEDEGEDEENETEERQEKKQSEDEKEAEGNKVEKKKKKHEENEEYTQEDDDEKKEDEEG